MDEFASLSEDEAVYEEEVDDCELHQNTPMAMTIALTTMAKR